MANARSGVWVPICAHYRNRASSVVEWPCEVLRYSRWPGRPDELNASMSMLPVPVLDLNLRAVGFPSRDQRGIASRTGAKCGLRGVVIVQEGQRR